MMAAQPKPAAKGSFFQKKELGLPIWAWALIVAGGAGAFILYTRMKGSSTSTGATSTAPTTTTGSTGPGGFGVGGNGGSGTTPTSPPAQILPGPPVPDQPVTGPGVAPMQPASPPTPASPGNPSLPYQVQSGSGWWVGSPAQAQSQPITDAAGNEYEWLDGAEYMSMANSGIQVYYEVLPGVFVPVPAGLAGLAGGTPLYMQVPSGTATNPSAPAAPQPVATAPATAPTPVPVATGPSQGAPVYN